MYLVRHFKGMFTFCVFRNGVHVHVLRVLLFGNLCDYFFLFVSLKEVHHGVYTTTYFEEHKGKFSELPKQSTEKGLHATPSYSQVQVPSIQLLCLKN